jgi:hypothetical protein
VKEPDHAGFSSDCATCHSSAAWRPAAFTEHEWPLLGAHEQATCGSCHTGSPPAYEGTPTDCVSCHQADRQAAVNPPHDAFSSDCGSCHGTSTWDSAAFEHTAFALTGAHQLADCASCHSGSPAVFSGTPTDCLSCHQADRQAAVAPPHDGFSSDCGSCHGTSSWDSAAFEHTAFQLTGAHQTADCASCHTGSPAVFAGTPSECVGCHRADYDASPFPGHASFPTTCSDCHTTSAWTPASGGAHPENRFPTTGPHNMPCNDGHDATLGPNGRGNANCVGCHTGEHTLNRMDAEHNEVGNYPRGAQRAPNFCLACHANGRE